MYPQGVCRIRKPASLATAALYFPFFKPQIGGKRSATQPQTIYSELPKKAQGRKIPPLGFCHRFVYPIRLSSTTAAVSRPSRRAQTTRL